uniref:TNF receptor superfamily member 1B n=1 Tax=Canis lupus dingo TaxID=286419 RepID=A0A8C0K7L5_CANLU
MAPAALWALLAAGLQLWGAGRAVPGQATQLPYVPDPELGSSCQQSEYFDQRTQMCCSMCPPGSHARLFCTKTSNTVCARCENSTYTQLWNWVPECLSCGSRCGADQVETQACTREQNRICSCKSGWYCTLRRQGGCRLCAPLRRCRPGFGVAKPGTATSDVVCAPCAPGTFSNTTSSTDTCRPHRICSSVAVPGNASVDAVCSPAPPTVRTAPRPASTRQPGSTQPRPAEPTPGPSTPPRTSVLFPAVPSPPAEGLSTGDISLPIGLIVGVTTLGLLLIGLVNCVIVTQKKKKPFCLQGEAKVVSAPLPSPCSSPCSSPLPCSPSCWAGLPSGGAVDSGGPCVLCPCWPCGRREGQPARARPQGQAAVQGHIREWGTPMLPPHPPPRVQGAGRGWPGVEREAGVLGPASCPHFHQSCSPLIFLRSRVCGGFCWSRTWAVGSWSGRHAVASHLKRRGLIFLTLWRVEGLPAAGPVAASLRETAALSSAPCGNTCPLAWGLTREVVVPPLYVSAGFAVGGGGSARQPPGLLPGRQTVSLEPWRPSSSLWLEQRRRPGRFPSLKGGGVGAGRAVTPTGQVGHSVYPA